MCSTPWNTLTQLIFWFSVCWTSGQSLPGWDKQGVAERILEHFCLSQTAGHCLGLLTIDPSKYFPCPAMWYKHIWTQQSGNFFWKYFPILVPKMDQVYFQLFHPWFYICSEPLQACWFTAGCVISNLGVDRSIHVFVAMRRIHDSSSRLKFCISLSFKFFCWKTETTD